MESQLILILSGAFIGYLPAHYAKAWVDRLPYYDRPQIPHPPPSTMTRGSD